MKITKIFCVFALLFTASCGDRIINKKTWIEKFQAPPSTKQYVFGTDDIPLFEGLNLVEEESSNFDTVAGNILISKYSGNCKLRSVKKFYLGTLPQLGWKLSEKESDKITFNREEDNLEIRFDDNKDKLGVRFFISSAIQ
ncbi:MAG: hypothetical protein K0R25_182 [Rickettsiaceae bacterium]|jgi:hypothetical protein|nr:hypothetical protein [Rickettsiaceae bacterium]